jgi:hypothetical protein
MTDNVLGNGNVAPDGAELRCVVCEQGVDYDAAVPLEPYAEPESWASGPAHRACRERYLCVAWAVLTPNGGILVERGDSGALCIYGTAVEVKNATIKGCTSERVLVLRSASDATSRIPRPRPVGVGDDETITGLVYHRLDAVLAMNRQDATCLVPRELLMELRARLLWAAASRQQGTPEPGAQTTGLRASVTDADVERAADMAMDGTMVQDLQIQERAMNRYRTLMRRVLEDFAARAVAHPDPEPDPLTVECSYCLAKPGKPCRFSRAGASMMGRRKGDPCDPHLTRVDRARYEAASRSTSAGQSTGDEK